MNAEDRARLRADVADPRMPPLLRRDLRALLDTADERDRLAARVAELEAALREARGCVLYCDLSPEHAHRSLLDRIDALLATPAAAPTTDADQAEALLLALLDAYDALPAHLRERAEAEGGS